MRTLKNGLEGEDVRTWEAFLQGRGLLGEKADGRFDGATESATKVFQASEGLKDDGEAGPETLSRAASMGLYTRAPISPMPFGEDAYRLSSKENLEWAVGGETGVTEQSPRYKLVTEGRDPGPKYSSCADLGHWSLFRSGVRSSYINRKEHMGWKDRMNVSKLAFCVDSKKPEKGCDPKPGDIWIIWQKPEGTDAHVLVCDFIDHGSSTLHSWDYGQAALNPDIWKPGSIEGCRKQRKLHLTPEGIWAFPDGRKLQRILPLWETLQAAHRRGELYPLYETPES